MQAAAQRTVDLMSSSDVGHSHTGAGAGSRLQGTGFRPHQVVDAVVRIAEPRLAVSGGTARSAHTSGGVRKVKLTNAGHRVTRDFENAWTQAIVD